MKKTLAITFAIIAVAGLAGWRNQREVIRATEAYQLAMKEAVALGIPAGPDGRLPHNRPRQARQQEGMVAADLMAFATQLQDHPELSEITLLDEREQRMLDLQRRLFSLDRAAMEQLIAEIDTAAGIREDTRQELLFLVMQTLAESHPDAVLEIIAKSPDLLSHPVGRARAAAAALVHGMATAPVASVTWFKENLSLFPDHLGRGVTEYVMRRVSLDNPKTAFGLIKSLGTLDAEYSVCMITNPARTPVQRDATLAAFREYLITVEDPALREKLRIEGTSSMISTALYDGVDIATEVLGGGRFTIDEIEDYANRHGFNHNNGGTGKWINWLQQNVPTESMSAQIIPRLVSDWTRSDYRAAGEWLKETEEGPTKTAATYHYAITIAERHPSSAAEWGMTLPNGEQRDSLLHVIYKSWQKTEPSAAAVFAEKNGIPK